MSTSAAIGSRNSLESTVRLACRLEATAAKPGNVHPSSAFADLEYEDFLCSADAVAPLLARAPELGLGRAVLDAVQATRAAVGRNTNLGTILLLAPLAMVPPGGALADGVARVLAEAGVRDSKLVYRAIRLAAPGGMGASGEQDLAGEPTLPLVEIMRLAAERDRVAEQYATGFRLVLDTGVPLLEGMPAAEWETAVIRLHLTLMHRAPDTLIARKCGWETASEAAARAGEVLAAGWPNSATGKLAELDAWLRADGHRRNPGTTADLVAASLFAALREGLIDWWNVSSRHWSKP